MKNKITDLRNHLFESIELLKDGKMEVAQAKAIAELGQTIINSGKLELDYIDKLGLPKTEFIPLDDGKKINGLKALEIRK